MKLRGIKQLFVFSLIVSMTSACVPEPEGQELVLSDSSALVGDLVVQDGNIGELESFKSEAQLQAESDAKYEAFENDLEGPFGNGLSISEEVENHEVNAVSVAIIEGNKIRQYHQ